MAVTADQMGFSQIWTELQAPYAIKVQDEVREVNPDTANPSRLNAAAVNAKDLAPSTSQLCPGS